MCFPQFLSAWTKRALSIAVKRDFLFVCLGFGVFFVRVGVGIFLFRWLWLLRRWNQKGVLFSVAKMIGKCLGFGDKTSGGNSPG